MQIHQSIAILILLLWATGSTVYGGYKLRQSNDGIRKAIALQFLVWGLVNLGIGILSVYQMVTRSFILDNVEYQYFAKLLMINGWIDFGYLLLGLTILRFGAVKWKGHGIGILWQGFFLLLFDWINYGITFLII